MKTIYHVGGWCRNYGDMAIQHTMMTMLNSCSPEPLRFIPIDLKMNKPITSEMVDIINERGDMLIVGGGGLIMAGDGFDTASGWQFNIKPDDLGKLNVPLVIYGAGVNMFPGETLSENTRQHLLMTNEVATIFTTRDKGSMGALREMGLTDLGVIPDPAMFIDSVDVNLPGLDKDGPLVGLCLAGDRLDKRFNSIDMDEWLEVLCHQLGNFLDFFGGVDSGSVVHIPHVSKFDMCFDEQLRSFLGDRFYNLPEHLPWMYPEEIACVPALAGVYQQMTVAVGMRGHSNIIPFGQLTPVLCLGEHDKNKFFADEVGCYSIGNDLGGLTSAMVETVGFQHRQNQVNVFNDCSNAAAIINTQILQILFE